LSVSDNGTSNVGLGAVLKLGKHRPPSTGRNGPGQEVSGYQPRNSVHLISGWENSNVGLGAARQDTENWFSQNTRLTTRKDQLRVTRHAVRRRRARSRSKNCVESTDQTLCRKPASVKQQRDIEAKLECADNWSTRARHWR
jgi:hypothetical protein